MQLRERYFERDITVIWDVQRNDVVRKESLGIHAVRVIDADTGSHTSPSLRIGPELHDSV